MIVTAPGIPKTLIRPKLLLGEGDEEARFFPALIAKLGISDVYVEAYRGKSKLAAHLRALKDRPGFDQLTSLGITRDADSDAAGAEQSVRDAIARAQFPETLSVSFQILPGNGAPGALENLCLDAIAGSAIEQCLASFFQCAAREGESTFNLPAIRGKAWIHAWLATRNPPNLRLGEAAEGSLINWSSPSFDDLKRFLQSL